MRLVLIYEESFGFVVSFYVSVEFGCVISRLFPSAYKLRDKFVLDEQHTGCCTMPQSDYILGSTMKVPGPPGGGGYLG